MLVEAKCDETSESEVTIDNEVDSNDSLDFIPVIGLQSWVSKGNYHWHGILESAEQSLQFVENWVWREILHALVDDLRVFLALLLDLVSVNILEFAVNPLGGQFLPFTEASPHLQSYVQVIP
jgi:hypothetical protein